MTDDGRAVRFQTRLRRSVTCWLQGGLGNQLFQINAVAASASSKGLPVLFSRASFLRDRLRGFASARVVKLGFETCSLIEELAIGWPYRRNGSLRSSTGPFALKVVSDLSELDASTLAVGFYQDGAALSLKSAQLYSSLGELRAVMSAKPAAARVFGRPVAHVRRGDYLTSAAATRTFGVTGRDYYYAAFERLGVGYKDVLFFTDDPDAVCSEFRVPPSQVLGPSRDLTDLDSLLLMSLGASIVIPNSTFSWWAAELSDAKTPVAAPLTWFKDSRSVNPFLRDGWIPIES